MPDLRWGIGVERHFVRLCTGQARPSALSGARKIVEVIFTFTNRDAGADEKVFVRVDVTEEFPFLVTKMAPYYEC